MASLWEEQQAEREREAKSLPLRYSLPLCGILLFLILLSAIYPYSGYAKITGFYWEYEAKVQDKAGNVEILKMCATDHEPYLDVDADCELISLDKFYYIDTSKGLGFGRQERFEVKEEVWSKADEGDMFFYFFS